MLRKHSLPHPNHKELQMAQTDNEQKSVLVKQQKRIAQGEKLDGTSLQPKGGNKPQGGLAQAKKK